MQSETYRYRFDESIPINEVRESLLLAVLAVEGIHGRCAVRLAGPFNFDRKKSACVIDGSTEIGQHVAGIFTGFLQKQFGDAAFQVERLPHTHSHKSNTDSTAINPKEERQ